ncbi:MarR family winged helix-turn-helix transcriptional regulator [Actinoallomurus sp. CA-142502]|uniref:MarR family winged helix-turn-helix transcriptional regulator n=1 Tax=Actinoallomurus sp. CA-142502 TaxID=3239885 RepID=UPI003D918E0F
MELIDQGHRRISQRLNLTRVRVLGMVAAQGPVRPSVIAAELGLTASATSRHLAALEQAGQVTVEPDPSDSRTFLVRQTERGRAEVDATVQAGAAVFAEVVADWTDEDIATARMLVTRLNQAWARRGDDAASAASSGGGPRWRRTRRPARTGEGED